MTTTASPFRVTVLIVPPFVSGAAGASFIRKKASASARAAVAFSTSGLIFASSKSGFTIASRCRRQAGTAGEGAALREPHRDRTRCRRDLYPRLFVKRSEACNLLDDPARAHFERDWTARDVVDSAAMSASVRAVHLLVIVLLSLAGACTRAASPRRAPPMAARTGSAPTAAPPSASEGAAPDQPSPVEIAPVGAARDLAFFRVTRGDATRTVIARVEASVAKPLREVEGAGVPTFSPNGGAFVLAGNTSRFFADHEAAPIPLGATRSVHFSPSGAVLVTTVDGAIEVRSGFDGSLVDRFETTAVVLPEARFLASETQFVGHGWVPGADPPTSHFAFVDLGRRELVANGPGTTDAYLSPSGRWLVTSATPRGEPMQASLWDTTNPSRPARALDIGEAQNELYGIGFEADERERTLLVSKWGYGMTRETAVFAGFDLATGKKLQTKPKSTALPPDAELRWAAIAPTYARFAQRPFVPFAEVDPSAAHRPVDWSADRATIAILEGDMIDREAQDVAILICDVSPATLRFRIELDSPKPTVWSVAFGPGDFAKISGRGWGDAYVDRRTGVFDGVDPSTSYPSWSIDGRYVWNDMVLRDLEARKEVTLAID